MSTVVTTETWTGTDAAAWPAQWTMRASSAPGGASTIQTNKGRLVTTAGAYNNTRQGFLFGQSVANVDLTCEYTPPASGEYYGNFFLRCDNATGNSDGTPNNGYHFNHDTGKLNLFQRINAVNVGLTSLTVATGATVNVRLQAIGSVIRGKTWTGTEPDWQMEVIDTTFTTGYVGLGMSGGNAVATVTTDYDNLVLLDMGTGYTLPVVYESSSVTAAAGSATAPAPAYPTGINAGDMLVLFVGVKPYTSVVSTPAGWTSVGSVTNGTTVSGIDTGSMLQAAFVKIADGTESGSLTLTVTSGNSTWASIVLVNKDLGSYWDVGFSTGTATAATAWTTTQTTNPGIQVADVLVAAATCSTDLACTWTSEAVTATAATIVPMFGTATATAVVKDVRVTTGNQSGGHVSCFLCTAGVATAAPVWTVTKSVSTNQAASTGMVRLRQVHPAGAVSEPYRSAVQRAATW
jgi:hypothetical protein